jgi:hypothetical protein
MAQDRGISLKRYAIQTNEWNISVHNIRLIARESRESNKSHNIWLHTKPDHLTKIPNN